MDINQILKAASLFAKYANDFNRMHVVGAVKPAGTNLQQQGLAKTNELFNAKNYPEKTAMLKSDHFMVAAKQTPAGWDTSGSYIMFYDDSILKDPKWASYFKPLVDQANASLRANLAEALGRVSDLPAQISQQVPWNAAGGDENNDLINFGIEY